MITSPYSSRSRYASHSYRSSRYNGYSGEDFYSTFDDLLTSTNNSIRDKRASINGMTGEVNIQRKSKKAVPTAKYTVGQRVYVKRYNPNNGKWSIYDGEIISTTFTKKGEICYTWLSLVNAKTYRALEPEIFSSYSSAYENLENERKIAQEAEEAKRKAEQRSYIHVSAPSSHECYIDTDTGQLIPTVTGEEMYSMLDDAQPSIQNTVDDMKHQIESLKNEMTKITTVPQDRLIAINTTEGDLIARTSNLEGTIPRIDHHEDRILALEKSQRKTKKLLKLGVALLGGL